MGRGERRGEAEVQEEIEEGLEDGEEMERGPAGAVSVPADRSFLRWSWWWSPPPRAR